MADKTIGELTSATSIGDSDLFVLQQNNIAKKLTGRTLANYIYQSAGYTKDQIEDLLEEMPQLELYTQQIINAYGAPRTATTKSAMSNHDYIYVYTGSESGMVNGNWYFWNGSAWTSGGIYNSEAFNPNVLTDYAISNKYDISTSIPEGSNLNNYVIPGNYVANTAAIAGTIINTPITENAFRLIVVETTASERILQIIIKNGASSSKVRNIYIRYISTHPTSGVVEQWKAIVTSDFLDFDKLKRIMVKVCTDNPVNFDELVRFWWIINASNNWSRITSDSNNNNATVLKIPKDTITISITPRTTSVVAFLDGDPDPVAGESPNYSSSYSSRITFSSTDTVTYTVDDTMHYLYFLRTNSSGDTTDPTSIIFSRVNKEVNALEDSTIQYNSYNAFSYASSSGGSSAGVTYKKNNDGTWTLTGTSTGTSFKNLIGSSTAVPDYIIPGRKYYLRFNNGNARIRVVLYVNGSQQSSKTYTEDTEIEIPEDLSGIIVRFDIPQGASINETCRYEFIAEVPYSEYSGSGGGGSDPGSTYTYNYNINTSPRITTDSHGWLQSVDTETSSETNKTDMTGSIMSMLNDTGYCHLGPGIFYVSGGISMPAGSKIEGCGQNTVIKLLDSVTNGNTIIMEKNCVVRDLTIQGSYTNPTLTSTIGNRNGILWTGENKETGVVSGVKIWRFTGAGILLQDTTQQTYRCLLISDCTIRRNTVGIYVRKDSEFNRITNCNITSNYYGVYIRGGNNYISNCGLDANVIGAQFDDAEGSNTGHGGVSDCSINHTDNNNGYGIIISGTGRMIISNCTIGYSKVKLENTNNNQFNNCNFMSSGFEIIGGECNLVANCMVRSLSEFPVTITNNTTSHFINCYARNGSPVVVE